MTETEFPVDTGTTITVSCQEGYINTGSKIVTCNTYLYQDFQYRTKPVCTSLAEGTYKFYFVKDTWRKTLHR